MSIIMINISKYGRGHKAWMARFSSKLSIPFTQLLCVCESWQIMREAFVCWNNRGGLPEGTITLFQALCSHSSRFVPSFVSLYVPVRYALHPHSSYFVSPFITLSIPIYHAFYSRSSHLASLFIMLYIPARIRQRLLNWWTCLKDDGGYLQIKR